MEAKLTKFPTYQENRAYYQRRLRPNTVSYLNSLENKSDRMGFQISTKHDAILQVSFFDYDPFPQVVCLQMILGSDTATPKIRSITALMRKSIGLRTWVENQVIAFLELRNESLLADAYESFTHSEIIHA